MQKGTGHLLTLMALIVVLGFYLSFQNPAPAPEPIASEPNPEEVIPQETVPPATVQESDPYYIEVVDSCGPYFDGECLNVRSGPGTNFPVVAKLRTGVVLKAKRTVISDGKTWHQIVFDEWLRYPERQGGDWYISAAYVRVFSDEGPVSIQRGDTSQKRIYVDRSEQKLYAYDGAELFMEQSISTGHDLTPTPRGTFTVYQKTPSRYMQGPIPGISDQEYDLPGVPWNLYFTKQGAVIHGAYWHDNFGQQWSHGCVNLPLDKARELYAWADLGTTVIVRD